MKQTVLLTSILCLLTSGWLNAQDFVQISTGASYTNQSYYSLEDQSSIEVSNDSWDLIFTTFGLQDAGILVNEASSSIFGMPAPTVELYLTPATVLSEVTTFDSAFVRVYNDEASWAFGAGNTTRNVTNPFDYGWGAYDAASRTVVGDEVYVVKLRSGDFKKFKMESLVATTYNLTYANLDGSEQQQIAVEKTDHPNGFAYFSFADNGVVDLNVEQFDLLFTRYVTPVRDPATGDTLDYTVTGILSAPGIETTKVTGILPDDVTEETIPNDFSDRLDVIGYDWKIFDLMAGWAIADSTSYIVRTPSQELYKLVFIDFEGSSTGVATFEQTKLGAISSLEEQDSNFEYVEAYPNPAQHSLNIVFSLKQFTNQVEASLFNALGQQVWQSSFSSQEGLQGIELPISHFSTGQYALVLQAEGTVVTRLISIQ